VVGGLVQQLNAGLRRTLIGPAERVRLPPAVSTAARYDAHMSLTARSNPSIRTAIAGIPEPADWVRGAAS